MRSPTVVFIAFLFSFLKTHAQTAYEIELAPISSGTACLPNAVLLSPTDNTIVSGELYDYYNDIGKILFSEFDSAGNIVNQQFFLEKDYSSVEDAVSDHGDVVLCGSSIEEGKVKADALVMKTNENGEIQWAIGIGDSLDDRASDICVSNSTDYFVTGTCNQSQYPDTTHAFVIKVDNSGNVVWGKVFSSDFLEAFKLVEDSKGNVLVLGYRGPTNVVEGGSMAVMKLNSNGDLMWSLGYSSSENFVGRDFALTDDDGVIIAGDAESNTNKLFLLKIDSEGTVEWSKEFGTNDDINASSIVHSKDGNFIVGGWSLIEKIGTLIKIEPEGNIIWSEIIPGAGYSTPTYCKITEEDDHQFLITGWLAIAIAPSWGFLYKTDPEGKICENDTLVLASFQSPVIESAPFSASEKDFSNVRNIQLSITTNVLDTLKICETDFSAVETIPFSRTSPDIFSNPFSDHFTISNESNTIKEVEIYSAFGQLMLRDDKSKPEYELGSKLMAGIYLLVLYYDNKKVVFKVVKL